MNDRFHCVWRWIVTLVAISHFSFIVMTFQTYRQAAYRWDPATWRMGHPNPQDVWVEESFSHSGCGSSRRHARSWSVQNYEWGSLLTTSGLAVGLLRPPHQTLASLNSRQEGLFNFQPTSRGLAIVIIH